MSKGLKRFVGNVKLLVAPSAKHGISKDYFKMYQDVHFVKVCNINLAKAGDKKHYVAVKNSNNEFIDLGYLKQENCESHGNMLDKHTFYEQNYDSSNECKLYCTFLIFDKGRFCKTIEKCHDSKLTLCNVQKYVEQGVLFVKDYTFYCYEPLESGFVDIENDVKMEKAELRNGMTSRPCQ